MTQIAEQTVGDIAIGNPSTIRVFENLGIDYCCGGKRTLSEACTRANVALESAIHLLDQAVQPHAANGAQLWNGARLSVLMNYIVDAHHGYVRRESPRISGLLAKVIGRHGYAHPEVGQIAQQFTALNQELSTHMMKEEIVLFPYVTKLEAHQVDGGPLPSACFDSVSHPIANMLADHDDAGAVLARMRELSDGYTPPEDACPTFRGLYQALVEFERDLHQHVHLENNILFPRAVALENVLAIRMH